eukprot:GHUV01037536.1.p1 GENE.GHUV01037536.1~~GHUV01037536.1.p1  ORF type:complete len:108 (+),score=22.22 GHUV01037536.1:106-429(+)
MCSSLLGCYLINIAASSVAQHKTLFSTILEFAVVSQGHHEHEAYTGDRTKDALVQFADTLVPSAGQPHLRHGQLKAAPRTPGCNVAGGLPTLRLQDDSVAGLRGEAG